MHRKNTFEPPSDLETYVFFEIPVEEVHVDGLEAHVEPENKHWTVSKPQGPHDVFVEGLLRRKGMKRVSYDGSTDGGMWSCSPSA